MYYGEWLFLVAISVGVSLVAFAWGLRSGQFSDQDRARYLPLGVDLLEQPVIEAPRRDRRTQSACLLAIVLVTFASMAAAVALALHHR